MRRKRVEIPFCQGKIAESGEIWGETPRGVYFKVYTITTCKPEYIHTFVLGYN